VGPHLLLHVFYQHGDSLQHRVAHYIYATGYAVISFAIAWSYRHVTLSQFVLLPHDWKLICLASVLYALLILGVAVDFPSGTIVGLLYSFLYGTVGVGYSLYWLSLSDGDDDYVNSVDGSLSLNSKPLSTDSNPPSSMLRLLRVGTRRPVLFHYFISYTLAVLFIFIYVASVGGFKSRSQSGL
jgi:hypothetical protein